MGSMVQLDARHVWRVESLSESHQYRLTPCLVKAPIAAYSKRRHAQARPIPACMSFAHVTSRTALVHPPAAVGLSGLLA